MIEVDKKTGEVKLMYVNDVHANTFGIPQWIVTRVKIDQLKVVKNIPGWIDKRVDDADAVKENI